jgi:hypothetical protein
MAWDSIFARLTIELVDASVEKRTPLPCILADAQLSSMDARIALLGHGLWGM